MLIWIIILIQREVRTVTGRKYLKYTKGAPLLAGLIQLSGQS